MGADNQIYLDRPRINDLLARAVQTPLVAVVAGAGYGKTQAVLSFLRKIEVKAAWIQLSERDNNEWRFWENFTRTVESVSPESAVRLADLGFPVTNRQFDRYILVPQKNVNPQSKYIFVYDDFHLLRNERVLDFIKRSITSPFSNITSILISRNEPAINTVGLLSKGLFTGISEDELRFSREEMVDFFQLEGITLPEETVDKLYRETEGWIFAIILAGQALRSGSADYGYSFMRENVFKHIDGQIFSSVSGELRKFLIKLSLIDHLPRKLLSDLYAPEGGQEGEAGHSGQNLIDEMDHIGSFIRFDTYLSAYRIHLFLLEYLKSRQDELTEEEKRDVYIRAGRWCAANNLKMDAVSYYEKAGDYDGLIDTVYTLPLALPDYITEFLMDILARAPPGLFERNAVAHALHTRLLFTMKKFDESEADAREIISRYEGQPPSAFNNRLLSATYTNLGFIGMITSVFKREYDFTAHFEKAHYYYTQSGHELQGPVTVMSLGSYICRINFADPGEPEKYLDAVTASLPHIAAIMNGCGYGMDDLGRAELAYFKGDLERAEKFLYQALYKAQKRNQYEIETRSFFYLLRIHIALGNREKLPEIVKLLDAQLEVPEYLNRYIFYDIILGWFYAQIGRAGKIALWLKAEFEERELNSYMLGTESVVRTKWYISEKQYALALASLESRENRFGLGVFLFGRTLTKIQEAICRYHLGEEGEALRALETAYQLAHPNALYMPFIEAGRDMCLLTGAALKAGQTAIPRPWLEKIRRNASAYAKKLSAAAAEFGETRDGQYPKIILSRQEIQVLTELSRGLTREEIGRANKLSVNRVKNIISGMYLKLGAMNRADAIRISVDLGLLKDKT
jgi:LuxR family maltose regulon positive regulatory protein